MWLRGFWRTLPASTRQADVLFGRPPRRQKKSGLLLSAPLVLFWDVLASRFDFPYWLHEGYPIGSPGIQGNKPWKYRPRQWETIEDRLKTLDVSSEIVRDDASAANYRKDFVQQIQTHIKAIIKTGKGVKISTQAAYLEREQKLLG